MKKTIIFMGTALPNDMVADYQTLSFNIADNIAQNLLIQGLHKHYGSNLRVISEVSDHRITGFEIDDGLKAIAVRSRKHSRVGYYLSLLTGYTQVLGSVLRDVARDNEIVIITRGSYIFVAIPVLVARIRNRSVKWVPFIITTVEVPGHKFPLNIVSYLSRWTSKKADGSITYVAQSPRDYMPGKPYQEIAYAIDKSIIKLYKTNKPQKPKKFTIAYTGSLSTTYNFDYIIDTIRETGNKYRWVFAGEGYYADAIKELSVDSRYDVDYLGAVVNTEAIRLQQESHLLICPRGGGTSKVRRYYSKYAASGKLTEYLCSGTPILASDVSSIHSEIRQFITKESGQTATHIVRDILSIENNYTDKCALARNGQRHAFKYFNAEYQNDKIYEFIEDL